MQLSDIYLDRAEYSALKRGKYQEHLLQMGLIESDFLVQVADDAAIEDSFHITDLGCRYLSMRRDRRLQFIKSVFTNFFVGVAVGIVATLAATYFTGFLRL